MSRDDLDLEGMSAVCFDAFGTLIGYDGRRLNPYRRLLAGRPSGSAQRLASLTCDAAEFDFRWNRRASLGYTDAQRTDAMLAGVAGKRLMYRHTS